jgi:hypothetical protein
MVDKIWFDWQSINVNATIPPHVRYTAVYDGFLGSELLDAERSLRSVGSELGHARAARLGTQ